MTGGSEKEESIKMGDGASDGDRKIGSISELSLPSADIGTNLKDRSQCTYEYIHVHTTYELEMSRLVDRAAERLKRDEREKAYLSSLLPMRL